MTTTVESSSTEHLTVSVIIPTLGRPVSLSRTIASVLPDSRATEVVVVIDGDDDEESRQSVAEWTSRDARVRGIVQPNAGSNAARERGVREARGSIVVMLDDDVVAGVGLISGHAARHDGVTPLIVVGYMPVVLPTDPILRVTAELYASAYDECCQDYEQQPQGILDHLWSGNVSMRRADVLAVGLTSALKLRYHVDMEFGIRCSRAGMIGVFDRSLAATHHYERRVEQAVRDARNGGLALSRIIETLQPRESRKLHPLGHVTRKRRDLVYIVSFRTIRPVTNAVAQRLIAMAARLRWRMISRVLLRYVLVVNSYAEYHAAGGPGLRRL